MIKDKITTYDYNKGQDNNILLWLKDIIMNKGQDNNILLWIKDKITTYYYE